MAVSKTLLKHLDLGGVAYEVVPHKKVYTAYDLAQTLGEKLDGVAKTLLVKVQLPKVEKRGEYFVVVVPASYRANFQKIKKMLKAKKVEIASEKAMTKLGLKPGAITPFAPFHGLEVLLDKALLKTKNVLVRAGSYTESLRVKVKDLHGQEGVTLGQFGDKAKIKLQVAVKKAKKIVKKVAKKAVKKTTKVAKKVRKAVKR
jgi:prolyl-tRNA editing enzyme YbaK/EbsC (Cys-tRNA(Pro) deacylase)